MLIGSEKRFELGLRALSCELRDKTLAFRGYPETLNSKLATYGSYLSYSKSNYFLVNSLLITTCIQ